MINKPPIAVFERIVVQEINDELLVCDTKNNHVFCLNKTAGEVWKLCDGKNNIRQMADILSRKLKTNVSEELVLFSLEELSKENLLVEKISAGNLYNGISRREVIKRIGLGSMIALPAVSMLVMPAAAQAQSGCPNPSGNDDLAIGCPCNIFLDCDSGCCDNGVCAPDNTGSCFRNLGAPCTSNVQCTGGLVCCAPSNPTCSFSC